MNSFYVSKIILLLLILFENFPLFSFIFWLYLQGLFTLWKYFSVVKFITHLFYWMSVYVIVSKYFYIFRL